MVCQKLCNGDMSKLHGPVCSSAAIPGLSRGISAIGKQRYDFIEPALASCRHQCCGTCAAALINL